MKKELTTEQLEKRKKLNKKIMLWFLLPVIILIVIIAIIPGDEPTQEQVKQEQIESQFSSWDSSHYKLIAYVKEQMNDPKSFEHIETIYWDRDNHLVVRMVFTGENAFGGRMKHVVKAKCDIETGNVIEVIQFD